MEPQRIKIEIKGIQRDVSPMLAPLGSCQQMTNLRIRDGALRPVSPKLKMHDAVAGTFVLPPDIEEPENVSYTLTVTVVGDGDVKINGVAFTGVATFEQNSIVYLDAVADSGNVFISWSGSLVGDDPSRQLIMSSDRSVVATFEEGCPLVQAAQQPIAVRSYSEPEKIYITWGDPNGFPLTETPGLDYYELETRQDSLSEWTPVATIYAETWNDGSGSPEVEYEHTIANTHDLTREYRVKGYNYCGNSSDWSAEFGVDPPSETTIRIYDADGVEIEEFISFTEYAEEKILTVKTIGAMANWYLESKDWGSGSAEWYTIQYWNGSSWVHLSSGSTNVIPHNTRIKVICMDYTPGEYNAYARFKIMTGAYCDLFINTATE